MQNVSNVLHAKYLCTSCFTATMFLSNLPSDSKCLSKSLAWTPKCVNNKSCFGFGSKMWKQKSASHLGPTQYAFMICYDWDRYKSHIYWFKYCYYHVCEYVKNETICIHDTFDRYKSRIYFIYIVDLYWSQNFV